MKQKKIWIRFLSIGIISCLGQLICSCGEEQVDYVFNADIVYKNETGHAIKYYQFNSETEHRVLVFELQPNSEKNIEIRGDGGSKAPPEIKDYKGIFEGFQGDKSVIIEYDNNKCLTYDSGEGPTTENLASGYEVRKITDRHYEFVYYFTEKEYNQASACN